MLDGSRNHHISKFRYQKSLDIILSNWERVMMTCCDQNIPPSHSNISKIGKDREANLASACCSSTVLHCCSVTGLHSSSYLTMYCKEDNCHPALHSSPYTPLSRTWSPAQSRTPPCWRCCSSSHKLSPSQSNIVAPPLWSKPAPPQWCTAPRRRPRHTPPHTPSADTWGEWGSRHLPAPYLVLYLALLLRHGDTHRLGGGGAVLVRDGGALIGALLPPLLTLPGVLCAPLHHTVPGVARRGRGLWVATTTTTTTRQYWGVIRCRGWRSSITLTSQHGSERVSQDTDGAARGLKKQRGLHCL